MRRYIFLLTSIALLLAQTLPMILGGRFTFAFDMGRDLLWVRNIVELKRPTLIGPWGSIAGVYFGPLWYYLLTIPYTIFNGDPRGAVTVPLAANLAAIVIGWLFLRRNQHKIAADVFALLYSVSPMIVSLSSFAFHANLLPLVTFLFLIGLTSYKGLNLKIPLAAFMTSIAYHLEPAAGVMLTGFLILFIFGRTRIFAKQKSAGTPELRTRTLVTHGRRPWKQVSVVLGLFIIPFVPQIIFELRHNFIQTNSLISYFRGENTSLGGVLPLSERITERFIKISDTLSYSLLSNEVGLSKLMFVFIFLFACLKTGFFPLCLTKQRGQNDMTVNYSRFTIHFFLFHYLAYTFLFLAELKSWYLSGFASLFILSAALVIEKVFAYKKSAGVIITAALILWNTQGFSKLIPNFNLPAAAETLTAQLDVVDWIYQDAFESAEPFSVYTYTPPIYDYSYQYLIWWRGTNRHGKLPAEFGYLSGETSYLPEKEIFVSSDWKPEDVKIVYLIIEPDSLESRQQGWLGHFAALGTVDKTEFPSGVAVEKRYKL